MTTIQAANGRTPSPSELIESNRRRAGWAMALRGIVAVLFGYIAVRNPNVAAGAFVIIFAVFAFADAILDFIVARTLGRTGMRWGWYVFAALISIAAGIVALAYPRMTLAILVLFVAVRAFAVGSLEIAAAVSWRELDSRWMLGLTGLMSIVFGILLFASPSTGGLALLWTIGVYAIALGVMLFVAGLRMTRTSHEQLTRGTPATAG